MLAPELYVQSARAEAGALIAIVAASPSTAALKLVHLKTCVAVIARDIGRARETLDGALKWMFDANEVSRKRVGPLADAPPRDLQRPAEITAKVGRRGTRGSAASWPARWSPGRPCAACMGRPAARSRSFQDGRALWADRRACVGARFVVPAVQAELAAPGHGT